jgi:hypothetical protein
MFIFKRKWKVDWKNPITNERGIFQSTQIMSDKAYQEWIEKYPNYEFLKMYI